MDIDGPGSQRQQQARGEACDAAHLGRPGGTERRLLHGNTVSRLD